jgi:peptidoglycan/xylan/chitin deacetylase (PgdA/CDA1 family)
VDEPMFADGATSALSITFDDARPSQLDVALPILSAHGVRATFYVLPDSVRARRDEWVGVAMAGHEIGNHTATHPCPANHRSAYQPAARRDDLEDYTPKRIALDIRRADREIRSLLGVRPTTFAYPCGHSSVGRGRRKASFVPLIAKRFVAGRGYLSETANDPVRCDLAELDAYKVDDLARAELVELVDGESDRARWTVIVAHDVGEGGEFCLAPDALTSLCQHVTRSKRTWVAPVAEVASQIRRHRAP